MTKRWFEIGLFLGISYGKLETLKTKSDDEKVRGVVSFWMKWNYDYEMFGKPSWKDLVRAIGARAGGNARRAAKKIAADHVATPSAIGKYMSPILTPCDPISYALPISFKKAAWPYIVSCFDIMMCI